MASSQKSVLLALTGASLHSSLLRACGFEQLSPCIHNHFGTCARLDCEDSATIGTVFMLPPAISSEVYHFVHSNVINTKMGKGEIGNQVSS
jgi:hypothetical protein